jgi:PKD repeat protein
MRAPSLVVLIAGLLLCACDGLPKPGFSWYPEHNLESGDSIRFFNESRRTESVVWDFGDGIRSQEEEPVHVYDSAGIFMVSLTALNDNGENTLVRDLTINEATVLGFLVSDSTGTLPLQGAEVWLYDNALDRDSLRKPLFRGVTGSEGSVQFRNMDPKTYHVWVADSLPQGVWAYRGFTDKLVAHEVNFYTISCDWIPLEPGEQRR